MMARTNSSWLKVLREWRTICFGFMPTAIRLNSFRLTVQHPNLSVIASPMPDFKNPTGKHFSILSTNNKFSMHWRKGGGLT